MPIIDATYQGAAHGCFNLRADVTQTQHPAVHLRRAAFD
jgi:hypothetical protein